MTDDLVKQLRDAFDAGSDNGWDQARADPLYGPHPMTNEEAFCAFLAALEPVAAPDHAAIREGDYFEGIEEGIKIGREAALREAAEIARDFEANGVCGIQKCTGGMIRKQILALIQKGDTDDRA